MLKEIILILAAIGCIFLIIPILWIIGGVLSVVLPLALLVIVLVYSVFDIKKLCNNKECKKAQYFALFQATAVISSFVILYVIFPYVTPKLLI